MVSRQRIAILGGGCAGVAAALQLTRTTELRDRFDVTLYTQGWRLGGKGASGRASTPDHRIEEHGLHLWMGWYFTAFGMMRDLLDEWEAPLESPFRDCASAFTPNWDITLVERHKGALLPWTVRLPPTRGRPWDAAIGPARTVRDAGDWLAALACDAESGVPAFLKHPASFVRRATLSARLGAALLRGWHRDVRPWGAAGYARIDHLDLRAWLAQHSSDDPAVIDAPPIRAIYDLAFAPDNQLAAGAALRTLLHVATAYRGAPFFRMPFGMGDTVFSPALDVLRARGVGVEFLHRVQRLRLDTTHQRVEHIELQRQAMTRDGRPLDGRVTVRGMRAWRSEAPWDALVDGEAMRSAGVCFESPSSKHGTPFTLEHGRNFDTVILALPAPACPSVVTELTAHVPAWRAMMETSATAATRSVQLWFNRKVDRSGRVTVGDARPHASRADMTDVLAAECWEGSGSPESVLYLCDALADGAGEEDVGKDVEAWLQHQAPRIWPGFSREWLAVPPFVRANVEGSDRYILTPPGSTAHRLDPNASGVQNLFLAGDWVRTSINGGSVEAAFEAGVRAANAIASA
jgi:uncharacterized protein with NAD-binding domain and iron-sulfur cluster